MEYYDTISTAGGQSTPVSTTGYDYNVAGNPTRIIAKPVASSTYSAKRFEYAKNGQAVTYVLGETWEWDGVPAHCPTNYDITFAREFRYDSGRARYLNRVLSPAGLMLPTPDFTPISETWSDYDDDEVYGDYTVIGSTVTYDRSFELGVATVDPLASSGSANTKYYHADLIGTTRSLSASGLPTQASVYTAFGERVTSPDHRYGYVGSWGYQSHDEFPFLHVGARYYDPSTGRFLQRDPIGIEGGLNVHSYALNSPQSYVDPEGELFWLPLVVGIIIVLDGLAEPAEAPSPWDDPEAARYRYRESQSARRWPGALPGKLKIGCGAGRATGRGVKNAIERMRSPNPPPYESPFPPMPKGPFYGGGQRWEG